MKNNHTQLKRLAAISLCLVMCLSALPMLAPPADAAPIPRGKICITFDDGRSSDYEVAFPAMTAAGIKGTSFVITSKVDQPTYLNKSQLLEMEAAGWEIGSHTVSHVNLREIPAATAIEEMANSKATLESWGLTVDTFAYPFGAYLGADEVRIAGESIYGLQRGTQLGATEYVDRVSPDMSIIHATLPRSLEQFKELTETAIETDTTVVFYWHRLFADGTIEDSTGDGPGRSEFTIYEVIDYVTEKMRTDGLQTINFRDLMDMGAADVITWSAAADGVASNKDNWAGGVAPAPGQTIAFTHKSSKNCTLDASMAYGGIYLSPEFKGTVKLTTGTVITLGKGGISIFGGSIEGAGTALIVNNGHFLRHGGGSTSNVNVHMLRDGTHLAPGGYLSSLTVSGAITLYSNVWVGQPSTPGALIINEGGSIMTSSVLSYTMVDNTLELWNYNGFTYQNRGVIEGNGQLIVRLYHENQAYALGDVRCPVTVTLYKWSKAGRTLTLDGDATIGSTITITSDSPNFYTTTVDVDDHALAAYGVVLRDWGELHGGNGTITVTSWDSTMGSWMPENSTVVLRDGGSVKLAPSQSFNRLEVASEDGRTVSWTMTATGTVAPIVTGLKSGSYLWYLDGVEQGEVEADKDGTIALSYVSTGLHELSVKPTSMTIAMDGVYQAVGIVAVLAVLGGLITMVGRLKF